MGLGNEKTWVSTLHAHSRMLTRFFEKKKKDKKKETSVGKRSLYRSTDDQQGVSLTHLIGKHHSLTFDQPSI